jgi:hypothetical protein
MTDTPPCLANFHGTPVFTRGPYDYHLATSEELSTTDTEQPTSLRPPPPAPSH